MDCLIHVIENEIQSIDNDRWRNQALRDLAVSKALEGDYEESSVIIPQINNPDTQAMTIRAIGMAVALHRDLSPETYRKIFSLLDGQAAGIQDKGAKDIAYTYIAMAQAFAKLDEDALKTTDAMTVPALKHKAFGETAEIQAERGDFDGAMKSITLIDSDAFRNKALGIVSGIFLNRNEHDKALATALKIENATKKAQAIQKIITVQQMPKAQSDVSK